MLLIVLKKGFFKLSILFMAKQWKIYEKEYVRLVNNEKDLLKYTSKPTHISHKIFGKNYAAIH